MRLEQRIALVTGGASGIGAATARRLAAEGARVAIADLNVDGARGVAGEIDGPAGGVGVGARGVAGEIDGTAVEMDVADAASVRAGVAAAEAEIGPIDVLVNNAGTD